ncbi:MAG: 50S ribosomal protein L33 [Erysipelotrichaceae bacterium]|nr:50S ribosomal protein L33 [Erysipelotrichaceae bacterium]
MRKKVLLVCTKCLSRNYTTTVKTSDDKRLEVIKHCKKCNEHTLHKQSK